MTEQRIERLVAASMTHTDATVAVLRLHGAEQALLEAVMSTPVIDETFRDPRPDPTRPSDQPEHHRPSLLVMVSVAAAFIAAIATPTYLLGGDDGAQNQGAKHQRATTNVTSQARPVAGADPHLLVDEPGWKITRVDGFASDPGDIRFARGKADLEVNWYNASLYRGRYEDRQHTRKAAPVQVLGADGSMFTNSARDFTVILPVQGKVFLELRGQGLAHPAFLDLLGALKYVDTHTWLAAMPASVVKPTDETRVADEMLADVPLPTGFDRSTLPTGGANGYYSYGARVSGTVVCSWIDEYRTARGDHNASAMKRAGDALATSHHWKVLHRMDKPGDWPEVVWAISDEIAAGKLLPPSQYQKAIGCGR
ncbi:MAG: hypothetical protein ACR2FG_13725 [Marmoricola sp.]